MLAAKIMDLAVISVKTIYFLETIGSNWTICESNN